MDCHEFDKRLEQYLSGSLSGMAWVEARTHWQSCAACRSRHEYAHDLTEAPPRTPVDEESFVHDVLTRTSGNACGRAESLIDTYLEGSLSVEDAELVDGHLQHCQPCQQLVVTLSGLKTPLREMAFIDPGSDFARSVVEATIGAGIPQVAPVTAAAARASTRPTSTPATATGRRRGGVPGVDRFWDRLRETWQGLIVRPGFALEAAYAATLILILAFGARTSSLQEGPTRAARLAEANPVHGIAALVRSVPWDQGLALTDPLTDRVARSRAVTWPRRQGSIAATRLRLAGEATGSLAEHGKEFSQAIWQQDEVKAGQQLQFMTDDLADLREAIVGELAPVEPDSTRRANDPIDIDAREMPPSNPDPGGEEED